MLHYSCDRCKKDLDQHDLRYVVKVETHAAMESMAPEEPEDDRDHLLEIQEILEKLNDEEVESFGQHAFTQNAYDLCGQCYKEYCKNPLGREFVSHVDFSDN